MRKQSSITVDRKNLLTALRLVKHAVAREKSRPVLSGINIYSKKDGTIDISGADGFRLAIYNLPAIIRGEFVSVFPLSLLSKLKGMKEEKITIVTVASQGRARINGEEIEVISDQRLRYIELVPKGFAHKATFAVKDLKTSLEEIKPIAKESSGAVGLETTEGNTLKILAGFEDERIIREIPAQVENPGKIAIHWRNLRDTLNTGVNIINFNGPADVCVFTGIIGFIEVVMPMFIEW